uniref:LCCL domain-containing protein n=1 Tax=Ciona savignyi TaxID=51511 RepID=H2YFV5_CIOSA
MIATSFENVPVSPLAEPDTDTNELELAPAEEIAVETFEQESNVSSKKPSNSYVKPIVAIAAGCIIVAGVVLMILAFTLDPDDFESKMLEFEGDIQLEESDAGFIEWKDSYNDLKSPDSRNLIKDLSKKIKGALGEESFSVKDVEIYALMPTGARSFSRNEESDDMTDPHYGGKNAKFSKKEYKGIMNVDAKFRIFGKPSENAASFMSAKPDSWWKLKKRLRSRLSNAGILSTVKDLKRNKRFEHAIKRGLRRKYVATTVPPVKREAEPCTCDTVLTRELSLENPSKVCYCESSCITGKNTVYGGLNDIFAIFTPVCASAFYAGVIPEEGGVVEALFTGRQEVKPGNQTIPEFTSESVPFVPRNYNSSSIGKFDNSN